jgi:hypothetical protein
MQRIEISLVVAAALGMTLGAMAGCAPHEDQQVVELAARVTALEDELAIQKVVLPRPTSAR